MVRSDQRQERLEGETDGGEAGPEEATVVEGVKEGEGVGQGGEEAVGCRDGRVVGHRDGPSAVATIVEGGGEFVGRLGREAKRDVDRGAWVCMMPNYTLDGRRRRETEESGCRHFLRD
ncbi:hypothetical protein HPP92_024102 [Vanilla planifolia]|uniref:Uncharacterized protein n=1 Tax=Vanilla planifolia TaxID=51239 RepID=A0A835PRC9_VANPL|nr:hypothetical protein HPP92_024102 [Vanilla planifolia]